MVETKRLLSVLENLGAPYSGILLILMSYICRRSNLLVTLV